MDRQLMDNMQRAFPSYIRLINLINCSSSDRFAKETRKTFSSRGLEIPGSINFLEYPNQTTISLGDRNVFPLENCSMTSNSTNSRRIYHLDSSMSNEIERERNRQSQLNPRKRIPPPAIDGRHF